MSLPDPTPPRKLSRLGLYIPFAIAIVFVIALSAGWVWARGQAETRMDAGVAALKKAGYELSWKERSIRGYPFRLDITLSDPRIRDRSGWALEAPRLEAEAFLHAITDATPKRRYMVVPNAREAEVTIRAALARVAQLNAEQPYTYDREALIRMLDEALAANAPR